VNFFDKQVAERAIDALHLERSNRELAARWLELWQGNALPPREAFRPANFKPFLSTIALFNVVPDESVTIRLAGTRFSHILGREITGLDWIAAAAEEHRAARLKIFSDIARGAILVDYRRFATVDGEDYVSEEMALPFAPDAHGITQVLAHANIPIDRYLRIKSVAQAVGGQADFKLVPLIRVNDAAGHAARDSAIVAA